ncbi:MAG: oxygen-independent coproporphyrinogen III oxidase [Bacteroidota bacterium]
MVKVDNELLNTLKMFDRPGPRYTSYPTAPIFSTDYDDKRYEIDVIRNNHENPAPLSLYLHIPFCDTLCYFCGCTTVITRNRDQIATYLKALETEIGRMAAYIDRDRQITQMHWGGGSPSYLNPGEIEGLSAFLKKHFRFAEDAEISVEIDPRGLTFEHMKAFRTMGVNRISLGVQDFDERVQRAVHRLQPEAMTRQALDWAATLGITSTNIDLIYGLPLQTLETFQSTLEKVVEISPDRIAVFNFAYVPWMKPHQRLIHSEDLPDTDTKLQLLGASVETLTRAGYEYIGMDHFAKPDDELAVAQRQKALHRNFQGYSTKAGADLYAFGMSAISHFGDVYAQNAKTLPEYLAAVESRRFPTAVGYKMTKDDQIRKFVIMRLMCDLEVEKAEVEDFFNISFDEYFDSSIEQLFDFTRLGMVRHSLNRITIEESGRLVLRNIAMCFDAYLNRFKERQLFSRTV